MTLAMYFVKHTYVDSTDRHFLLNVDTLFNILFIVSGAECLMGGAKQPCDERSEERE